MRSFFTPFLVTVLLGATVAACKDAPVSTADTLLPASPCDTASNPAVGSNGFVLGGSGFNNQVVRLGVGRRGNGITFDTTLPGGAGIDYGIQDTAVVLATGATARVTLDMQIPGFVNGSYDWNSQFGNSASGVRLEIIQAGVRKVFRSETGRTIVDSLELGSNAKGSFCGFLKDSLSDARVAIMSGRFSTGE